MSAAHFDAAIPQPFRILGLRLLPLSLGRYQLLRRLDVAFVSEKAALAKPGDLILGVFVCSNRVDQFIEMLNCGTIQSKIERWGRKLFGTSRFTRYLPRQLSRPKPFDYVEKVSLFNRYLHQAWEAPKYWEKEMGDPSGAHWSQSVEVALRGELGWTLEEINETPIGKALSDYYKWLENKGAIQLMTEYESEICEGLEKAATN